MYRGRIAPTPSGWLHLGHASTFRLAWQRARQAGGQLVYRTEDIDPARCQLAYAENAMEDLQWWGLDWDEGPDKGGSHAPYVQSERLDLYRDTLQRLHLTGRIYPSPHSRKQIREAKPAASPVDGDPLFPTQFRGVSKQAPPDPRGGVNWRFRVEDGREIRFHDNRTGTHRFVAGRDFGDFIIWKKDGYPSYELAVVADDHAMAISEVVRGEDLLLSTARQLLLYNALGWNPPEWYHCPLVIDPETGWRMSKTHESLALRKLRERGLQPGRDPEYYFQDS